MHMELEFDRGGSKVYWVGAEIQKPEKPREQLHMIMNKHRWNKAQLDEEAII